jgi:hypothetical protein
MPASFVPNPAFAAQWLRSPAAKTLLETVVGTGVEEVRALAGGHARYEDAVNGSVEMGASGYEGVVYAGGKWGFIFRFAEFGTSHQPARPMLRPGVETAVHHFGGSFKASGKG